MVDEVPEETPLTGCLLRLIWSFGNGGLVLLLIPIVLNDSGLLSFASIGFWILLGLVVVARYVDVTCYAGTMPDGTPATLRDVNRFSAWLVVIASAAWVLAHAL